MTDYAYGQTGKGLLSEKEIRTLQSFEDGGSGYFYQMLAYLKERIDSGIHENRFTEQQARADREIALWYAFACNNIDRYEYYYMAAQWMPDSEPNARGCGAWYYRYACALLYCGRLDEALRYAEQGVREQPDYPWGWLQLGRLRSHFGDRAGAREAVRRGLALVPGDYEFCTLEREIQQGRTLEEMENHWIAPSRDQQLQAGLDTDAADKLRAIAGIICHPEALRQIQVLFSCTDWQVNCPYCSGKYRIGTREVMLVFRMNEAALSKLDLDWLRAQKALLDQGGCLTYRSPAGGKGYPLDAILIDNTNPPQLTLAYRDLEGGYFERPLVQPPAREEPVPSGRGFVGYVLLSEAIWDRAQLLRDLQDEWGITPAVESDDPADSLVLHEADRLASVSLVPAPVPDGEAASCAADNYAWSGAVGVAEAHQAHLIVAVPGELADAYARGVLFVQLMASCAKQVHAVGLYTSGTVWEPALYRKCAQTLYESELPVLNWVWFGLYRNAYGVSGYTNGLRAFGKDEIEIIPCDASPADVRDFLATLATYVLEGDVMLRDGESIGFSAAQKLPITRSPGVALPGMTLKIPYAAPPDDENK